MAAALHDLRFAVRVLRRDPGYTLSALAILALGIGANTAIFGVTWHVLLKPLPYPDGERVVSVWETALPRQTPNPSMPAMFDDLSHQTHSFAHLAAYAYFPATVNLTGAGDPLSVKLRPVTGDYFNVFEMPPLAGRVLTPDDANVQGGLVVLSEHLARQLFGDPRAAVGQTVHLNGGGVPVAGVMPAAFEAGGDPIDLWSAMRINPQAVTGRVRAHYLGMVARLAPGISIDAANADVARVAALSARQFPESNTNLGAMVRSLHEERGGAHRPSLLILAGAAAFVLLAACANLGSLQFARNLGRRREFGIRAAIGASRAALMRQLIVESVALAGVGGALGVLLSRWILSAIVSLAPRQIAGAGQSAFDPAVLMFAAATSALAALFIAIVPAWRAAGSSQQWLGSRTGGDRGAGTWRSALVAVEVGLTLVLLVGAGLLLASLANVRRIDPGFSADHVLTLSLTPPGGLYRDAAARDRLFSAVAERLHAVPGVQAFCATNAIPFGERVTMTYVPEGQTGLIGALPRTASPECFATLGIGLRAGRTFQAREPEPVAVVSEGYARAAWPGDSAVGKRIHIGLPTGTLITVVGVVADTQQVSLESPQTAPEVYQPLSDDLAFVPDKVLVKTTTDPLSILPAVRRAVHEVDPLLPVANVRTLDDVLLGSLAARRFILFLLAAFAVVALALAVVGAYGLLTEVVTQRTAEFGIRIALGARSGSIVRLVMRTAWLSVGVGLAGGLTAARALAHLLDRFVFHVSVADVWIYAGASLALALAAVLAAWLPARRAGRVDPVAALRG